MLNPDKPSDNSDRELSDPEIVKILGSYLKEAQDGRKGGQNPRDPVWNANLDLYWGRFDFSGKADWQSKLALPEGGTYVDRWAAAMKDALKVAGDWYTISVPGDEDDDLAGILKKFLDCELSRCFRDAQGRRLAFPALFEEVLKLAGPMAACAAVTPKRDNQGKIYISAEPVDPRSFWLDPTGRGMYRVREIPVDEHMLKDLALLTDDDGEPLLDTETVAMLVKTVSEERLQERNRLSGTSQDTSSNRKPIILHEYIADVVDTDGEVISRQALCIVANDKFLIRGPEENPFWHDQDWIVFAPAVPVPLAPYGKSYMEGWAEVAKGFVELSNLILDSAFTSAMKAFAAKPEYLQDPNELAEGIHPNKTFLLSEDCPTADAFWSKMDLGSMPSDVIAVWTSLKQELREGAMFSEISLGQVAPKGDVTATEASLSSQSSSSFIRSVAQTIETRFLEPLLNLIFKTALQHLDPNDKELRKAVGDDAFQMLLSRAREFASSSINFAAHGISSVIDRAQKLRSIMALISVVGTNQLLLQEFLKKYDIGTFLDLLIKLHGIDPSEFEMSARDRMLDQIKGALNPQPAPEAQGSAPNPADMMPQGSPVLA